MDPVAFRIGSVAIYWYGIIIAGGIVLGLLLSRHLARKRSIPVELVDEFLIYVVPLAILGARIYYVLFNLDKYNTFIDAIAVWEGGLAIHGAIITGILVALVFCRIKKISFFNFADIASPSLILGQAIGRWGNYVNQEAYGRETDLPWAILVDGAYVHPTFLYESLWNLLVLGFLIFAFRRLKLKEGSIFAIYLIGYSFGRIFIEGLRTDSLMFGPFRVAQLTSGLFILAGAVLLYLLNRRKGKLSG